MGSQVSGDRVQETAEIRNHGTRKQEQMETTDHDTADNLTTQDSVTGSNIAPVNDPQLERISLNQTHPHTDTCTHTHNRARMGPGAHEP